MGKFRELLLHAKQGNVDAVEKLYKQYQATLKKNSYVDGTFDEDLYQVLSISFLVALSKFKV